MGGGFSESECRLSSSLKWASLLCHGTGWGVFCYYNQMVRNLRSSGGLAWCLNWIKQVKDWVMGVIWSLWFLASCLSFWWQAASISRARKLGYCGLLASAWWQWDICFLSIQWNKRLNIFRVITTIKLFLESISLEKWNHLSAPNYTTLTSILKYFASTF